MMIFLLGCGRQKVEQIPISHFFSTPEKTNFKLSPDGRYIAYIGMDHHCRNIYLLDLDDPDRSKQLTYQNAINVRSFMWGNNTKIVFLNEDTTQDSLRLYRVDIHQETIDPLLATPPARLRWIPNSGDGTSYIVVGINDRDSTAFDLYKLFLDGRPRQQIFQNPGNMNNWILSSNGQVKVAIANDSVQQSIMYRSSEKEAFQNVFQIDFESNFRPIGFVGQSDSLVYALSNIGRDKIALVEFDLAHRRETKVLFDHKDVDVDEGGYAYQTRKILFANYTIAKQKHHFFDEKTKSLYDAISGKVDGFEFRVLSTDSAGMKVIFRTYTDTNPGAVYYFDAATGRLTKLTDNNPELKDKALSPNEFIRYKARDGVWISGYLTYPLHRGRSDLPVVVIPHDGPNGREVWGFDQEAQFLANRGYLVFQMNYRGSTGYGKKFWTAGFKEWGGKIQDDITDGVRWLIKEGIADRDRISIVGKGFGGYSALYAACFNSDLYKCAVSYSGYTNLFTYFRDIPPYFKGYVQKMYQIVGNPVREAQLFKNISPVFHSDRVKIPVLLAQGGKDRFSSVTDANQFVQKLKNNNIPVQYYLREDEGKVFRKDENIFGYYVELEHFLKKYLQE